MRIIAKKNLLYFPSLDFCRIRETVLIREMSNEKEDDDWSCTFRIVEAGILTSQRTLRALEDYNGKGSTRTRLPFGNIVTHSRAA